MISTRALEIPVPPVEKRFDRDRIGVIASVLCAIHCLVAPLFLIAMPRFGGIWAHPASHWIAAAVVVPLAASRVHAGFRSHRRRSVVVLGSLGIVFVLAGAMLPWMSESGSSEIAPASTEGEYVFVVGQGEVSPAATTVCFDECCPSIVEHADGSKSLYFPPASIITTLGGIFLIFTHVINLCGCSSCSRSKSRT